jgi:hypothetical protein
MDDREIRTYMGQPDPMNDDFGAKTSEITVMRDQSYRHTGYSSTNREYSIMCGYSCVYVLVGIATLCCRAILWL